MRDWRDDKNTLFFTDLLCDTIYHIKIFDINNFKREKGYISFEVEALENMAFTDEIIVLKGETYIQHFGFESFTKKFHNKNKEAIDKHKEVPYTIKFKKTKDGHFHITKLHQYKLPL